MKPRIDIITLAVDDLERSLRFYREGMGLATTDGITGTEFQPEEVNAEGAVVIFELEDGLTLALYPRGELAKDAGIAAARAQSSGFQHRPSGRQPRRSRRVAGASASGGGDRVGWTARAAVGHLLGLLPRPRRSPVGDHLEPAAGLSRRQDRMAVGMRPE